MKINCFGEFKNGVEKCVERGNWGDKYMRKDEIWIIVMRKKIKRLWKVIIRKEKKRKKRKKINGDGIVVIELYKKNRIKEMLMMEIWN